MKSFKNKIDYTKALGEKEYFINKYNVLYGNNDYSEKIKKTQDDLKKKYIYVFIGFIFMLICSQISTNSSMPKITKDEKGDLVKIQRPTVSKGLENINVEITASSREGVLKKSVDIGINPHNNKVEKIDGSVLKDESVASKMDRNIMSAVRSLNTDTRNKTIVLPRELEDGTKIVWKAKKNNNLFMFLILGIIFAYGIFYSRYEVVRKEEKMARESITVELPEYINKMVLLLSAGVVFERAFDKMINDHKNIRRNDNSYFYNQLEVVNTKAKETNIPVEKVFSEFAQRIQVKELIKISNIISDSVKKGTELRRKLERESSALWFARKKHSEEKGRIAETKLTLPLVILLLVLVMITIAPAMLEM